MYCVQCRLGQACAVNPARPSALAAFDGTSSIGDDWPFDGRVFTASLTRSRFSTGRFSATRACATIRGRFRAATIPPQITTPVPPAQAVYASRDARPITVGAAQQSAAAFPVAEGRSGLADGSNVWGTATQTLTITNTTAANAGDYTLVVTNTLGAVTSAVSSAGRQRPQQQGIRNSRPKPQSAGLLSPQRDQRRHRALITRADSTAPTGRRHYGHSRRSGPSISGASKRTTPPCKPSAAWTIPGCRRPLVPLSTNTVTFTAWINPDGRAVRAGVVW